VTRQLAEITTVRERLWLLAHDQDRSLQLRMNLAALEVGLMGATMIDLLLAGLIRIDGDSIRSTRPWPSNAVSRSGALDPITAGVCKAFTDGPPPKLLDVLWAPNVELDDGRHPYARLYQRTRAALIAHGLVVQHQQRFRSTRYELADPRSVTWHRSNFFHRLVYFERESDALTDCLCALVWALDLHEAMVTPYEPSQARDVLWRITEQLPARAGPTSALACVPQLAVSIRCVVGDIATAAF
jgi:Golgi phosphoprotein 3 GPP34